MTALGQANEALGALDDIVQHTTAMAVLIPWFLSWGARAGIAFPLMLLLDTPQEKLWYGWVLGVATSAVAFIAAYYMWPGGHKIIWGLTLALASPWAYLGTRAVLGWALPGIKARIVAKLQKPETPP